MDTVEFLDLILPSEGWLALAIPYEDRLRHFWFQSTVEMATRVAQLDARGVTVYHANAGFLAKGSRAQANVAFVRSFWLDVDVGEAKPYPTFKEACRAILTFAQTLGLPQPYIVRSGTGAHVYWPLGEDIEPGPWKAAATRLKAACKAFGLMADPSRTSDEASILRPVGSTHRKGTPRPVELKVPGQTGDFQDIDARLTAYLQVKGIPASGEGESLFAVEGKPASIWGVASNEDLVKGVEYEKKYAEPIANGCGVLAHLRETRGNVDQPTWYHALGVIAWCEDGDAKAHEWSAGHPDYTVSETNKKLSQIRSKQSGPTSCEKLGEFQPSICAACPHKGKFKTPAVLGYSDDRAAHVVQSASSGSFLTTNRTPFPPGYTRQLDQRLNKDTLQYMYAVPDPDGGDPLQAWETFCHADFYPVSRIEQGGEAIVEFERVLAQDMGTRRFSLTGSAIGKGKESWAGVLGMNEIVTDGPKGAEKMDGMLKRWLHQLTETAAQVQSHMAYGWVDGAREFVLGDRVLQPGGISARAILTGPARQQVDAFTPKGDLATWIGVIDKIYNAPGQEGYQFLIAAGFAAPLLRMQPEVNGITIYAHSDGSGVGKTTAALAALSIWGDHSELQLSEGKATQGSLWALMGVNKSVPVVFDELTNMDPRTASELVYSVSSGRAKQRLKSDGDLRKNNSNWRTIMIATGNTLLSEKLSQHRANAEAEMSRLFEYTLDATPHLKPNEVIDLFPQLLKHHGVAGEAYIRYVIDNYDTVAETIALVRKRFNVQAGITQKERFWSALMASVLVATSICNKLGLLGFSPVGLKTWMVERLSENRTVRKEITSDPLELVGKMLADLNQGILTTMGEGDLRKSAPAVMVSKPHGALVGRAIQATKPGNASILLLNDTAVRDWAVRNGVSAKSMFEAAVKAGWCSATFERYALGKGTLEYAAQSSYLKCWKMFPERWTAAGSGSPITQRLQVVGSAHGSGVQQ